MVYCFKFQVSSFKLPNHAALHEEGTECCGQHGNDEIHDFA